MFDAHPGTVTIELTLLLLCSGRISNVRTTFVLRAIPEAAIPDPVRTPPVVITAAPPTPPRKPAVPDMPIVVNAAPRPAPITGARSPADNPITSPPPGVAKLVNTDSWEENKALTKSSQTDHHVSSLPRGLLPTLNDVPLFHVFDVLLDLQSLRHPLFKLDQV